MNWIRNHIAASLLLVLIGLASVLFVTGKLRWHSSDVHFSADPNTAESGEAAEKKVKQGKVVLDAEDFEASGVEIAEANQANVGEALQAPGEVQPIQARLAQIAPPIGGIVRSIYKLAGDPISAGGALASVESAELGSSRADLQSALAERDVSQRNYERWKQLYEKGLRSQTEVWTAEADYNKARLRVEAASARLRALGLDPASSMQEQAGLSNRYELRSPLTGIVLQQQLTIGQNVEQKDVLFTVADLSTVWVTAAVHEKDIASIHKGTSAAIEIQQREGSTTSLPGQIDYISQLVDQQTRTVPVRITVTNRKEPRASQGYVLRPGLFTTVRFITGRKTASVALPLDAVQEMNGQTIVFVQLLSGNAETEKADSRDSDRHSAKAAYTFEPRAVTLGTSDGKLIEVIKGLKTGERVVVRNAFLLKSELEKEKIGDQD